MADKSFVAIWNCPHSFSQFVPVIGAKFACQRHESQVINFCKNVNDSLLFLMRFIFPGVISENIFNEVILY